MTETERVRIVIAGLLGALGGYIAGTGSLWLGIFVWGIFIWACMTDWT